MAASRLGHAFARHKETLVERVAKRIATSDTGCHLWQRELTRGGYGQIWWKGRTRLVNRALWEETRGPIPKGQCICHTCDTPSCVNPAHHFLGSNAQNSADMVKKGRTRPPRGEEHGCAKLTEEQVEQIRQAVGTQRHIAALFDISQSVVCEIRSGKAWKG